MHRWIHRGRPHSHFRRRRWRFSSSSAHCRLRSNHRLFFPFDRECDTLRTDPRAFHQGKCLDRETEKVWSIEGALSHDLPCLFRPRDRLYRLSIEVRETTLSRETSTKCVIEASLVVARLNGVTLLLIYLVTKLEQGLTLLEAFVTINRGQPWRWISVAVFVSIVC